MLSALWWGGLAASTLFIGYFLASRNLSNRTIGIIMGIGAGALIGAIAYELVPLSYVSDRGLGLAFLLGAFAFYLGDWLIDRFGGGNKSKDIPDDQTNQPSGAIFVGSLLDAVPESLILGMSVAVGGEVNVAFLIAAIFSNIPEALGGTIDLIAAGYTRRRIFWMWTILAIASAAFAGLGYIVVFWMPGATGDLALAFSSGALLTMLAGSMMPEAFERGGKLVGLFTVLGFLLSAVLVIAE